MADFVLFFCSDYYHYYGWRGNFLYDNLTYHDTQVKPYEYHSAYNQNTGIVYVGNNSANQLQGVLGSNHTTQYTYNGNYRPLFVDKDGKVWCVASSADKYIYLFEADLSDVTIYTLKAGNPLTDKISYITPTFDSQYVYLMYDHNTSGKLAKYALSNLDGGDAEWSINANGAKCIFCDEDNNVYVLTLSSLTKYSGTDGSQVWSITAGGYYGFYSLKTGMIYVPYDDGDVVLEVTVDGDIDGSTPDLGAAGPWLPRCVGGSHNSDIYIMTNQTTAGSGNVWFRYSHSDWDSPETEIDHKYWFLYNYRFAGDPAGYVNYLLRSYPEAEFSGTPRSGYSPLTVQFTDSSNGNVATWLWDFGDGETSNEQNPEHIYSSPGVYDVSLTVTTDEGWEDTETKTQYIRVTLEDVALRLDELAVRLEDPQNEHFTEEMKLEAYNKAQVRIVNHLKPEYLPNLQLIENDIDISSGEYSLSSFSESVINGREGIFSVKVTISSTDYWAYEIDVDNLKRLDNPYFLPDGTIFFYIDAGKLYFRTSTDLSLTGATADVYMMKVPDDMTDYVTTELTDDLREVLVCCAEYYCWQMDNKLDRMQTIKNLAMLQLDLLNYKFTESPEVIITGDQDNAN